MLVYAYNSYLTDYTSHISLGPSCRLPSLQPVGSAGQAERTWADKGVFGFRRQRRGMASIRQDYRKRGTSTAHRPAVAANRTTNGNVTFLIAPIFRYFRQYVCYVLVMCGTACIAQYGTTVI